MGSVMTSYPSVFGAARTDSNLLPPAYKAGAHPHELLRRNLATHKGIEPFSTLIDSEASTQRTHRPLVSLPGLEPSSAG